MGQRSDSRAAYLLGLPRKERRALLARMGERQRHALRHHWRLWAHEGQLPPEGDWLAWLILAGRGFGKTRAGAEWIRAIAEGDGAANAPPAEAGEGQCWLVGTAPTGAWAGQGGRLALYQSGQWLFQPARDGMRLLDRSSGTERRFAGEWRAASRPAPPSGGTTVDAEARSALSALIDSLTQAGILPAA